MQVWELAPDRLMVAGGFSDLALQTPEGVALSALSRNRGQHQGIWIVEDGQNLAETTPASLDQDGPHAAAEHLVGGLCDG
jgi:hypothetical protein